MRGLQNRGVYSYLINTISIYECRLEIGRGNVMEMKAGVPQDLVQGPLL